MDFSCSGVKFGCFAHISDICATNSSNCNVFHFLNLLAEN
jgi:hypothetical protein